MAQVSLQHLKLRDFVYVSGHLGSYLKLSQDGTFARYYEVPLRISNPSFFSWTIPLFLISCLIVSKLHSSLDFTFLKKLLDKYPTTTTMLSNALPCDNLCWFAIVLDLD